MQVQSALIDPPAPGFSLNAMFRSRGEHERAIRVHQALALRERDKRKLRQRAMYELGLDFRAAGMPRRATKAMEEVLLEDPGHEGALRALHAGLRPAGADQHHGVTPHAEMPVGDGLGLGPIQGNGIVAGIENHEIVA